MRGAHVIAIHAGKKKLTGNDGEVMELPKSRAATFRARCSCGWSGGEFNDAPSAERSGLSHVRTMAGVLRE